VQYLQHLLLVLSFLQIQ